MPVNHDISERKKFDLQITYKFRNSLTIVAKISFCDHSRVAKHKEKERRLPLAEIGAVS